MAFTPTLSGLWCGGDGSDKGGGVGVDVDDSGIGRDGGGLIQAQAKLKNIS